jgi:hypothetical protein
MPGGNPSPKLAITIDSEVHQRVLAAAAREGVSVSAWMTSAAREALRRRAGLEPVAEWEEQHGSFSAEEMDERAAACARNCEGREQSGIRREHRCL